MSIHVSDRYEEAECKAATERFAELPDELDRLGLRADRIDKALAELTVRLEVLLRPSFPTESSDAAPKPAESAPLVNRARNIADQLGSTADRIAALSERLCV